VPEPLTTFAIPSLVDRFLVEYGLEVGCDQRQPNSMCSMGCSIGPPTCDIAVNLALGHRIGHVQRHYISIYIVPKKYALLILDLLDIFKILDKSKTLLLLFIYILTELC
jgi:hypothetical protein